MDRDKAKRRNIFQCVGQGIGKCCLPVPRVGDWIFFAAATEIWMQYVSKFVGFVVSCMKMPMLTITINRTLLCSDLFLNEHVFANDTFIVAAKPGQGQNICNHSLNFKPCSLRVIVILFRKTVWYVTRLCVSFQIKSETFSECGSLKRNMVSEVICRWKNVRSLSTRFFVRHGFCICFQPSPGLSHKPFSLDRLVTFRHRRFCTRLT